MIEDHLSDENVTPDFLAEKLFIGRTQFFQKVKALTGLTAGALIRKMKIQRAAQILIDSECSIGDAASAVGIIDQSHFSRLFKKEFGCPPSKYRDSGSHKK